MQYVAHPLLYILNFCIKVFNSSDNSACLCADLATSWIEMVVSSTLFSIPSELVTDCSALLDTVSTAKLACSIALSICVVPLENSSDITLTNAASFSYFKAVSRNNS